MIVLSPGITDHQRELVRASVSRYIDIIRRATLEVIPPASLRSEWDVQRATSRLVVDFAELLKLALNVPGMLAFRPALQPHAYFNASKVDARNLP